jgi:lysophospholipase L1-like esterase
MMMYRNIAVTVLLATVGFGAARAEEACPVAKQPPVAVMATKKRMNSNKQVVIVALGSSSTEGWRATTIADSYPARLQADLSAAYPQGQFAVINRGIGGQDALEEVARMDSDAIALKPDLVIWQVGANGAMANSDPNVFRQLVGNGIERLKAVGIDVVLMDNQRAPMILASPGHLTLERTMAELAVKYNVSLFSRGALMDGWKSQGHDYAHYMSDDNVHMNDLGYRCLADALAESIEDGLRLPNPPAMAKNDAPTVHASK